jgi:hypothetical protein
MTALCIIVFHHLIHLNHRPSQGTFFCPALTGIYEFFLPCPVFRAGRPQGFYTIIEYLTCSLKCAGKPKNLHHAAQASRLVGRGGEGRVISSAKIENTLAFLPNFWKSFSKLWQKPDFYTLFGIFSDRKSNKNNFYEQNSADSRCI